MRRRTYAAVKVEDYTAHCYGCAFSALLCPRCGDEYLHAGDVRNHESDLVVMFWCENCGDDIDLRLELRVTQHKGCTHLTWFYDVDPEIAPELPGDLSEDLSG